MANSLTYNRTKVHWAEGAAASTPDAAEVVVYAKSDGLMYSKDDAGTETLMSSGASLSNPMTTAEDIIYGGASGTATRKALGASNSFLGSSNSTLAYVPLGVKVQAPDSLNAIAAPSSSDNYAAGWRRGSIWTVRATGATYMMTDERPWATTWTRLDGSSGVAAGHEYDYTQITSGVTVTGTAEGAETTVITGAGVAYDGATVILIEFFSPDVRFDASATGQAGIFILYEDATLVGRLGVIIPDEVNNFGLPLFLSYRRTPTAGTRAYIVKAIKTNAAATFVVDGGAGGAGTSLPAYIRVTKAT